MPIATILAAACSSAPAPAPAAPAPSRVASASRVAPHAIEPWLPGDPARTQRLDLAGEWDGWLDPSAVGLEHGWADDLSAGRAPRDAPGARLGLRVPGPIEATDGTRMYDGVFWLARDVELPAAAASARVVLHLGQVNDVCRAWWDGEPAANHAGGYDAVDLQLDGAPGRHRLVLMVLDTGRTPTLGRTLKTVPHSKEDWYENFGGVLGPVGLDLRSGWCATSLRVQPDAATGRVEVRAALLSPPGCTAEARPRCEIARGGVVVANGELSGTDTLAATLAVPSPAPWSPESPALYELRVRVGDELVASQSFGFRSFEIRDGDVFLDGTRRVLKGVLWQPHFTGTGGMVPTDDELAAEAGKMKAAGFDLVRAHVRPAPPAFLDACDRLGLMVLEEPAIGWVDDDPALPPLLQHEVEWMVRRDRDRTCVVMWGLLNELSGHAFLHADALEETARTLDPTRPVLRDSGGFFGARWRPPGAEADAPMTDSHLYPPWPLPPERRDELASLGADASGPTFASEFGYGAMLDAARAADGFRSRGLRDEEAGRFRSFARTAKQARDGDEGWASLAPGGDWTAAAQQAQADALSDMSDALRSGGALDLLFLTQWRAASAECSAGLLDPWGEERPSLAAMRAALAPVRVIVLPDRPSWGVGTHVTSRVVVANDGDASVEGRLQLDWRFDPATAAAGGTARAFVAPRGVSSCELDVPLPAAPGPGALELVATFDVGAGPPLRSAPARVAIVPPRLFAADVQEAIGSLPQPLVWAPADETAARAFLSAHGLLAEHAAEARVALLPHAARIADLPFDDALAVWSLVLRGGAAVVLLQDPAADDLGRLTGAARGTRHVAGLPLPVAIAPAAGNFNGRFHVLRAGGSARLLGRGDESVSPVAMVAGPPPEGSEAQLLTLGFLGNRLGSPWIAEPFGAGRFLFVGLPLLDPVRGAPDPLRASWLTDALGEALHAALIDAPARRSAWEAAAGRALPAGRTPLSAAELNELQNGLVLLDRLIALADRAATLTGADALPEAWRELPARRQDVLTALLLGDAAGARATLASAVGPLWTAELQAFAAGESRVLDALAAQAALGPPGWATAWDGVDCWSRALSAWFGGRPAEADDWLGRANAALHLPR